MPLWVAVLLASCGGNRAPVPAQERKTRIVASFYSQDRVSLEYALRLLAYHRISTDAEGSLGVSIRVDESRAEEATTLLGEVPDLRPFVSSGSPPDVPAFAWENDVSVDADLEQALEQHDPTSPIGMILRRAAQEGPSALIAKYPVVDRVKWRSRAFIHMDLTPATAIEALVLFTRERGGVRPRHVYVSVLPED